MTTLVRQSAEASLTRRHTITVLPKVVHLGHKSMSTSVGGYFRESPSGGLECQLRGVVTPLSPAGSRGARDEVGARRGVAVQPAEWKCADEVEGSRLRSMAEISALSSNGFCSTALAPDRLSFSCVLRSA